MPPEPARADATIVITTKNRRDDLSRALQSALEQEAAVHILVIDDGSTDGTAEHVRSEFPDVTVHRNEESLGLIRARNLAAELATTPVLVSIDDDAVFSSPRVVSQTLEDIEAPRIGAVAIPHQDVNSEEQLTTPRAPDDDVWVTATFIGTAYAVRRDVFLSLGGFRGDFVHQGEEPEFCLRMLDAGWWCRVGRADQIDHFESPRRDMTRIELHSRRNELLHVWSLVPGPWAAPYLAGYAAKGILHGFRVGRPGNHLRGVWWGARSIAGHPRQRDPVRRSTMRIDRQLRRDTMSRLSSFEDR